MFHLMGVEETKNVEPDTCSDPPPPPPPVVEHVEDLKDVVEEKSEIPLAEEKKPDESKALAVVEKPESTERKEAEGSISRDAVLERVATEKRLSLVKAWEESEKSKAENKAQKKVSAIAAWENCKKASLEAELKKIEEQLENKKAKYIEKMKNKVALVHKTAEEKRATAEAKRGEDLLKAEETAAKYRATGTGPKKLLGCF
ncbi:remorin-like isoform X1 [Primulina eburnea]|uniref:remorin-like isoform X1 n=2 Tax=Primulina eburnea TaxID=1245227 RepID=UPI003C6BEBC4